MKKWILKGVLTKNERMGTKGIVHNECKDGY